MSYETKVQDEITAVLVNAVDDALPPFTIAQRAGLALDATQRGLRQLRAMGVCIATEDESRWTLSQQWADKVRARNRAATATNSVGAATDDSTTASDSMAARAGRPGYRMPRVLRAIPPRSKSGIGASDDRDPWLEGVGAYGE